MSPQMHELQTAQTAFACMPNLAKKNPEGSEASTDSPLLGIPCSLYPVVWFGTIWEISLFIRALKNDQEFMK